MKALTVFITVILLVVLVGCGNTPDAAPETDEANASTGDTGQRDIDSPETNTKFPVLDTLTKEEYKELNIFLSNFVETYLDFYAGQYDEDHSQTQITVFAIDHIFLNDRKAVTTVNGTPDPEFNVCDYSLDAAQVDAVLEKYIGPHQKGGLPTTPANWDSGAYYRYESGKYYFSMDVDVLITQWAQTTEMYDNKDGTFTVIFDRYERYVNSKLVDFPENHFAAKENWGTLRDMEPMGPSMAVIKKGTWNQREVWQLVSFNALAIL